MHIHILGICGTFMAGVAILARELGYKVSGCDANVYPPMSTQLQDQGIELIQGYAAENLPKSADLFVVGNAMSRGNECVEYILDSQLPFTSGPQFIHDHILINKWVLAVAGTHGKTTTSSILASILDFAGIKPGFLIGGVPENFGVSARLGESDFFVIEADEYDTAFFDKRSKFVHYNPRTLIANNLEFDHADIFENLDAIKKQFHHLFRILPANGLLIAPQDDENVSSVIDMGCWTPIEYFRVLDTNSGWGATLLLSDGSHFDVLFEGEKVAEVKWSLLGQHNVSNALAAIAAARHCGVPPSVSAQALTEFVNVKRRMELRGQPRNIFVYDDFAHHPTAIKTTLQGLRDNVGEAKIIAVFDPRSNSMRMGIHQTTLSAAFSPADEVLFFNPGNLSWNVDHVIESIEPAASRFDDVQQIIDRLKTIAEPGDHIVVMSNGAFDNIHQRLLEALA